MNFLIHHYLDAHARASPEQEAAVFLEQRLTYRQLHCAANRLANCLLAHGAGRGDRVGIYMDKCIQVPIAVYGIMKAAGVYVPLDPSAPAERIAEIIEDCGIELLISADSKKAQLARLRGQLSRELAVLGPSRDPVDSSSGESWKEIQEGFSELSPPLKIIESDLAYIIYTSGSTGKSKGIMHTHHSGLSFARWAASEYHIGAEDRLSNHAPLHFDLSIFDYFAALVSGATTIIIPEEYTRLPASYSQLIADSRISVLFTVPFALIQLSLRGVLNKRDLQHLRLIIFGGEPIPPKYLRQLMAQLPGIVFDNMYGPAEVNGVSHYTVPAPPASDSPIPIGPISQIADALVVDEEQQAVAPGETGQLLVRTPTMMAGYCNRPELNESVFYRHTGSADQAWIYYKTGDLVRIDENGTMWFAGRMDRQVKVRGYRVELDEIETALAAHEDVEEAAVYVVLDEQHQSQIRGAFRLKLGIPDPAEVLLVYLKDRLPWYAVPEGLLLCEEFPRTSTGKIDRRALSLEDSL